MLNELEDVVEYKHLRSDTKRSVTFAIQPPSAEELLALLPYARNMVKLSVHVGIAECSKNDDFTKSIGRKLAFKRLAVETEKTLTLLQFQLIKNSNHSILYTDFLLNDFVLTFRSFLAKDYSKTDCHTVAYMETK
jgi:hypothetical protein